MNSAAPLRIIALLLVGGLFTLPVESAQNASAKADAPDLSGVYQAVPDGVTLPGGLRNSGGPADVPLLPAAVERSKTADLEQDPAKMCQPIGPFRMMARDRVKFELVPVLARGIVVLLFEDVSRGHMRTVVLDRARSIEVTPTWHGHSIGRWEGGALVVETVAFNERTWLNDAGALHSDALKLVERIRPVGGGRYLEYKVTAADPAVLVRPYTYTRYFERLTTEILEDVCEE